MKKSQIIVFSLIGTSLFMNSCSIIGGIFKAGMSVGIFLVVLILVVILAIVLRAKK